jgi:basic membrane protein A
MMKKIFSTLLIIALIFSMVGCASGTPEDTVTEEPIVDEPEAVPEEPIKVGLLLAGPISDMGWNTMGYNGLLRIEEDYDNLETAFVENISQSDRAEVLRNFAGQGYDIIIGHGFGFNDPANELASEYPDTDFVIIGGFTQEANVSSMVMDNVQQGFLAGIVAGIVTESNIVGGIGGLEIPPITKMLRGFAAGAKYVNPEVEALTSLTGNMTDANQAKEIGISMVENGADVLMGAADSASLGIVEAAAEQGALYIGTNTDMREAAPDSIIQSALGDGGVMYTVIMDLYLAGELGGVNHAVGIKESALSLIEWDETNILTAEQIAAIDEAVAKLASGEIDYLALAEEIEI